jgi:hypothetical protein
VSAFTVIRRHDLESRFFAQFKLVWFSGSARTDKALPFWSASHIFDVRTIAIVKRFLQTVLRVAVGTLDEKARCLHRLPSQPRVAAEKFRLILTD